MDEKSGEVRQLHDTVRQLQALSSDPAADADHQGAQKKMTDMKEANPPSKLWGMENV